MNKFAGIIFLLGFVFLFSCEDEKKEKEEQKTEQNVNGTWLSVMDITEGSMAGTTQKDSVVIESDFEVYNHFQFFKGTGDYVMSIALKGSGKLNLEESCVNDMVISEAYQFNWNLNDPEGEWYYIDTDTTGTVEMFQDMFNTDPIIMLSDDNNELTIILDADGDGKYEGHGETMYYDRVK